MKKIALILLLIQYYVYSQTTQTEIKTISTLNQSCTCLQILNEKDCQSLNCTWDGSKCSDIPVVQIIKTYCELIQIDKCQSTEGCANVSDKCVSFAGCSLFFYTSNELCQNISIRCITDGDKCIELNDCMNYTNQISCLKDQNGMYCTWNSQTSTCEYPETCDLLPLTLNSDQLCREQLKQCTTKEGGGCETSQENCENQKIQQACVTNLDQTKQCIWDESKCKEKTCLNAPISNNSHLLCNTYLSTCTVNDTLNGCQDIPQLCTLLKTYNNCTINKNGDICYWNKSTQKCEDKNCDNAPDSFTNNDQCLSWLQNCTVKSAGLGCQTKVSDCVQYTTENQCIQTITGDPCFWNQNKCYAKICDNAPDTYINHDQCSQFLSTCTVQQDLTGCESKKASCSNYQKEEQCNSLMDGSFCVFQDNVCIPRICSNASKELTTDQACKRFSPTCMVKSNQQGCILQECINITNKEYCLQDYQNNQCYYGTQCHIRTCENAPNSYKSDEECRTYLASCTIDDDFEGCKVRPLSCTDLNELQCKTLTNGTKCSWNDDDSNNKFCRLLNCADIPPDTQTDESCSKFDKSCTVAENPSLCMQKPAICGIMITKDHCLSVVLADGISKCSWNDETQICRQRVCSDADTTNVSEENCRSFMPICTINDDKTGCVQEPTTCKGYKNPEVCIKLVADPNNIKYCGWNGCEDRSCQNAPILLDGNYNHSTCNSYLEGCTLNDDQTGCVSLFTSCGLIKNQIQCNETILVDKSKCTYDLSVDPFICRSFQCIDNTSSDMTHALCVVLGSQCTLGIGGVGCVNQFNSCSAVTDQIQCDDTLVVGGKQCFWDASAIPPSCKDRVCSFGQNKNNYQECEAFMSTCTKGGINENCIDKPTQCNGLSEVRCNNVRLQDGGFCSFDITINDVNLQCHNRICADAPASYQTDTLCRSWLPTCTVKADQTGCINEPNDCTQMMREQCFQIKSTGITCFWNTVGGSGSCREAQCTDASKSKFNTDTLCQSYKSDCTAAKSGGCIAQPTSCNGLEQDHCPKVTINATGKSGSENKCSWNTKTSVCQDRVCSDAPISITTESGCRAWLKSCTIGLTNKGCINEYSTCDQIQTLNQCSQLSNGQKCGWNNGCVGRQCSNAPDTYNTDEQCRSYLSKCTVQADGTGCELRKLQCIDIDVERQCVQIDDNNKCSWNVVKKQCEDRSCINAPITITSHNDCEKYLSSCTVKPNGKGCQRKLDKCQNYSFIGQCKVTLTGQQCQWIINYDIGSCVDILSSCSTYIQQNACTIQSDGQICIWIDGSCYNRQCQHAPKSYSTHKQCQEYGNNCTTNGRGCINYQKCSEYKYSSACLQGTDGPCTLLDQCQLISCENAPITLKTDSECSTFLKKCTTNGNGCIEKKRCQDAYIPEACKFNSSGQSCAWVNNQCYDKTCETADISLKTETQCEEYFPEAKCTTKKGGGCIQKGKCKDAQIELACTSQYDGKLCSWQDGSCKMKSCSDLFGTDHYACYSQQNDCTSDGIKCISMKTCSNTDNRLSCVLGTDGPCLWSNNQCYRFTKCTDLIYTTHQECNQIHSQCTTNGDNCISISTCANTPQIACYLGIKNLVTIQCIWAPLSNKQSSIQQCIEFTECSAVYYLNHNDCYNYSQGKCTTDGIKGCIDLDSCENYTNQASCFIDKQGKKKNAQGNIISTGFCQWTNDKCTIQGCSELIGTTHEQCNSQLNTCTSNGSQCILKTTCNTLKNYDSCIAATGTDGKCAWINNTGMDKSCNPMKCSDYPITQCSSFSSDCIQDGSTCVEISYCSIYKTEAACDKGSINSVCVWIQTSASKSLCIDATNCSIASANQKACKALSDRCYWQRKTISNVLEYICISKTCEVQTDGTCTGYYDWDKKIYTVCKLDSQNKCVSTDPTTLNADDCLTKTLYQYTWNNSSNKCQICNTNSNQNNNSSTPNNTNNQSTFETILFPALIAILSLQI
ncbi:unnamed protein product [Paramecium pentaurelia]|uniref:SRCR domain-containing protein n=1 Tax=Paramecium pentaurelia TaxID=43138 RepID=A0A8S1X8A4_9CILI|nr:unnamed protein product [Paramecium pentaurelia]